MDIVWRAILKKAHKVREPFIAISSSRSTSASRAFEGDIKQTDGISISSSTLDSKLEEIVVNQATELSMSRSDVRKSKSKVRTYLKKCKDALYGHSSEETCIITVNEDLPQSSNTSWYLATESNDSANKTGLDQLPKAIKTNQVDDQEAIDKEIKCMSMTETEPLVESQVNKDTCTVSSLVDKYLSQLYPLYQEHTRNVLVRQARDILVCIFHGDLTLFEQMFLVPAVKIIERIKQNFSNCLANEFWQKGWPLASSNGALVLHLGAIDDSLVRLQDIYLCIRSGNSNVSAKLYACWRTSLNDSIVYYELDPEKHSITPLSIEMLAGEDLPHLLQTLLVGVEHAICRIPLDELTFPPSPTVSNASDQNVIEYAADFSMDDRNAASKRAECNLKRRELITKNNSTNKKYAIKRITFSGSSSNNQLTPDESETRDDETIEQGTLALTTTSDVISSSQILTNETDSLTTVASTLPLFCLGGSFPHIDSDEESGDDAKKIQTVSRLPHDIVAPRSIQDLPEKLLMSGCFLPGNVTRSGLSLIVIESDKVHQAGLNCYELATLILFYNTIPMHSTTFVIHLIARNDSNGHVKVVLDKLDNGLQLLHGHVKINSVLITLMEVSGELGDGDKKYNEQLPISHTKLAFASTFEQLLQHIAIENLLSQCNGLLEHDQHEWKEFFKTIEPLQSQCLIAGRRLVSVLNEIRNADLQGPPTRRQLHSQHRALCRALMDSDLQNLRRRGPITLTQLQDHIKRIRKRSFRAASTNAKNSENENKALDKQKLSSSVDNVVQSGSHNVNSLNFNAVVACAEPVKQLSTSVESFVEQRLNALIIVFNEVNRAAKRLEQLTEQHRERLRELTRQRALEDEINEVIEWIKSEGENSLTKYGALSLECSDTIRDEEQEFEKYYFISMKHIAKGKDLIEAVMELESMKRSGDNLNSELKAYSVRLESLREKIEGAARLHHLLALKLDEDDIQKEMQKLAEKIGLSSLMAANNSCGGQQAKKVTGKMTITTTTITTSTPKKEKELTCDSFGCDSLLLSTSILPSIEESPEKKIENNVTKVIKGEEEEMSSKLIDSGMETFDESFEMKDRKLSRACSCQSIVDDATQVCDNSQHDHDDADLDDYDTSENITSISLDEPNKCESLNNMDSGPLQANAHLYCHASNLQLDLDDNSIDQKTQKTLLLIIREMIGTERDYVRSLYYVIDNYMQELLREDIPQALRGQRNVIFGNIERIHEFHQQHFCKELEMYEHHPLKVGAAFLRHEPKFYLYALYNKNKPKSDSLMSEYGSAFFKSKQFELKDKMDLASYLLKPVQRMGKYALLLQQLMKACSNIQCAGNQELIEDLDELQKAEEMVRFQLRHGNDLLAMDSLRECDVNVKEQGRLLRQNEFLVWEGRGGKKSLRQVFLFEELVLFSKARRFPDRKNLDIYIYKNSIKTSDIGLTAFIGDSPTKFEIWFRKRKPGDTWTLQSMNEEIKNTWADEISQLLWKQAKKNREIRMAEMSSMGIGSKPCLDIRPSCDQINDRSISFSQLGKAPKFRNSFVGTLPDMKSSSRRPNSIISLSSSASSGDSSVSSACNKTSNGHDESDRTQSHCRELQKDKKKFKQEKNVPCKFKYSRSTTVVSQCSTESGILADFSSLSPEECLENPRWPSSSISGVSLKKSNSILTSVSASSGASVSTTSSSSSANSSNFGLKESGTSMKKAEKAEKSNSNSSISDVYLNENNVTVHL